MRWKKKSRSGRRNEVLEMHGPSVLTCRANRINSRSPKLFEVQVAVHGDKVVRI